MTAISYLDSYWVVQDQLLAGEYPGDMIEENARHKIQSLIQAEISLIIDLTRPGDTFYSYANLLAQEAEEYGKKIKRINFPITDYDIPSIELMTEILNTIDEHLEAGGRAYFHCVGGIGRTGTVACCYLVRHGMSGAEAITHLQYLRRDVNSAWHHSPQSHFQIEFVHKWPIGG